MFLKVGATRQGGEKVVSHQDNLLESGSVKLDILWWEETRYHSPFCLAVIERDTWILVLWAEATRTTSQDVEA